ncbi:hypothetical protein [Salibacterium aidingense]|uniref:hypothetical protein n=1 Tax=Salibacterium aidingense TaxID=384933 RepID=UPI003BD9EEC3
MAAILLLIMIAGVIAAFVYGRKAIVNRDKDSEAVQHNAKRMVTSVVVVFVAILVAVVVDLDGSKTIESDATEDNGGTAAEEQTEEKTGDSDEETPENSEGSEEAPEAPEEPEESEKENEEANDSTEAHGGVTDDMIDRTVEFIESEDLVKDAAISRTEDGFNFAIIANPAINDEAAKQTAENFVRNFASNASSAGYEGPSADSLGGIWDSYDLNIGVFTPTEEPIVRGAKMTNADGITW